MILSLAVALDGEMCQFFESGVFRPDGDKLMLEIMDISPNDVSGLGLQYIVL